MKQKTFEICPGQPLKHGVRQVFGAEFERARDTLTDATRDPQDRVHGFRKTTKRLRSLLRLVEVELGSHFHSADQDLRDAARLFSDIRDQVVLRETAQRLGEEATTSEEHTAIERLNSALSESDGPETSLGPSLDAVQRALVLLARAQERVGAVQVRVPHLSSGLTNTYRKARARLKEARALDDDALHSLRKAIKYHRYQLRLLRAGYRPVMNAERDVALEISELLGEDHDLVVLQAALGTLELEAGTLEVVAELIEKRRERLQGQALPLCDRLLLEKPKARRKRLLGYFQQARAELRPR